MVPLHRAAEGSLQMTRSWMIHILWNVLLYALLGPVPPPPFLQFAFHYSIAD